MVGAGVRTIGRPRVQNEGTLVIGNNCVFRSTTVAVELVVAQGAELVLGFEVILNTGVSVASMCRIELGNRVLVGPSVIINDTSYHELYDRKRSPEPRPVVIEDDAWLGAKATIAPGVRVGRGAVIVGHALVTKNVEPFTIVSGVPAQEVGRLDERKFVVEDRD